MEAAAAEASPSMRLTIGVGASSLWAEETDDCEGGELRKGLELRLGASTLRLDLQPRDAGEALDEADQPRDAAAEIATSAASPLDLRELARLACAQKEAHRANFRSLLRLCLGDSRI